MDDSVLAAGGDLNVGAGNGPCLAGGWGLWPGGGAFVGIPVALSHSVGAAFFATDVEYYGGTLVWGVPIRGGGAFVIPAGGGDDGGNGAP